MSDGVIISFESCKTKIRDPIPLARLLSLADFPLPEFSKSGEALTYQKSLAENDDGKDKMMVSAFQRLLETPKSTLTFCDGDGYEYGSISLYGNSLSSSCGQFRTETVRQTTNTMERLASGGRSFLDFLIALQKLFASNSFSDENTNSVGDYLRGDADLSDRISLPLMAFGLPDEVGEAMLLDPDKNQLWETEIGPVVGNSSFCEGALKNQQLD